MTHPEMLCISGFYESNMILILRTTDRLLANHIHWRRIATEIEILDIGIAMKDGESSAACLDQVAALKRIASALEKITEHRRRKSIGALFGSIGEYAHKHVGPLMQHPDEYAHVLLEHITFEYPRARYPADITRFITPEIMVQIATSVLEGHSIITGEPQYSARVLVYSLRDAGFWRD
jgi:hypothetical protein